MEFIKDLEFLFHILKAPLEYVVPTGLRPGIPTSNRYWLN